MGFQLSLELTSTSTTASLHNGSLWAYDQTTYERLNADIFWSTELFSGQVNAVENLDAQLHLKS
jgi:hypothetical protein